MQPARLQTTCSSKTVCENIPAVRLILGLGVGSEVALLAY